MAIYARSRKEAEDRVEALKHAKVEGAVHDIIHVNKTTVPFVKPLMDLWCRLHNKLSPPSVDQGRVLTRKSSGTITEMELAWVLGGEEQWYFPDPGVPPLRFLQDSKRLGRHRRLVLVSSLFVLGTLPAGPALHVEIRPPTGLRMAPVRCSPACARTRARRVPSCHVPGNPGPRPVLALGEDDPVGVLLSGILGLFSGFESSGASRARPRTSRRR